MKPIRSRAVFVMVLAVAALIAACGGGSGAGLSLLPEGGTSGTGISGGGGISSGQVSSFGSVRVNARTYLTNADDPDIATLFVGPSPAFAEPDLAVGMLVQVLWDQQSTTGPRRAQRITYLPELVGTVTNGLVDATGTLEVAGRTVLISKTTVFADVFGRTTAGTATLSGPELLTVGSDRVEVSGFLIVIDPDTGASRIEATRVARIAATPAARLIVTGVVANATAGAFEIRDASGRILEVSFDAGVVDDDTLFVDSGSTQLTDGEAVRITGERDDNAILAVSRISRPLADLQTMDAELPETAEGEIAGAITQAGEDDRFRIANQRVVFDDTTVFLAGSTAADVTVGRRASATGTLRTSSSGAQELLAAQIFVEPDADVELEDVVTTAAGPADDDGNRTFETRIGITVVVRPNSLLKDDTSDSDDGRLDIDTLAPGDFVEIRGFFDPTARLVAVKLERDDDEDECLLEARVAGSQLINGQRHYTIANRPGLVVVDIDDDSAEEKIPPGGIGEFESDEPGNCATIPSGADIDGLAVDAGFLAEDVDREDDDDEDDEK